jgi:hypothetical protein
LKSVNKLLAFETYNDIYSGYLLKFYYAIIKKNRKETEKSSSIRKKRRNK